MTDRNDSDRHEHSDLDELLAAFVETHENLVSPEDDDTLFVIAARNLGEAARCPRDTAIASDCAASLFEVAIDLAVQRRGKDAGDVAQLLGRFAGQYPESADVHVPYASAIMNLIGMQDTIDGPYPMSGWQAELKRLTVTFPDTTRLWSLRAGGSANYINALLDDGDVAGASAAADELRSWVDRAEEHALNDLADALADLADALRETGQSEEAARHQSWFSEFTASRTVTKDPKEIM